jgi:DNA polymerase I-like protein with 3'-5' exonuclease and polymerase domains
MRFGCPVINWRYDTAIAHHSWFSELKKDLSSLAAFYVREYLFWDVATFEGDNDALYHYNALDTWNTTWAWLAWVHEAPAWAKNNYAMQFRVQFPSILMEITGIAVDAERMREVAAEQMLKVESARKALEVSLDVPGFNPGSSKQVQQLLNLLGVKKPGTDEKLLRQFAFSHPLNHWLVERIVEYRKAVKLVSTYLNTDKLFHGVMLYSLTSYATRTGRLASGESALWCGANIQNIPRGKEVKQCYVPFPGFLLGEVDKAQAESYCTGFISGDTELIEAVTGPQDFHSFNGSKFFGVPYEAICKNLGSGEYEILDKPLRQLAKPINHGCSYCMGAKVLVDTMGLELVFKAGNLLGLTSKWSAEKITEYLILKFSQTYPVLTQKYWQWVIAKVRDSKVLVGATGWTRYCFGRPDVNKRDANAYIAHAPQSLNAMQLNDSVFAVFMEVWMPHHKVFKLCVQIHDSILFQVAEGSEHLVKVKEIVERTSVTQVTDIFGITRKMRIPADSSNLSSESWARIK